MKKIIQKHWKLGSLLIVAILLLVIGLGYFTRDPLAALKEIEAVNSGTEEAEAFTRDILLLIEQDDMRALAQRMTADDNVAFQGKYSNGIFREKDFCPAEISGTPTRLKISSFDHISLYVKSQKRDTLYQFSLVKSEDGYAIASISPVKP